MRGQQIVRATAADNSGQNSDKGHTHTVPGIEPVPPGWKAGILPTMPRRRTKYVYTGIKF